MPGPASKDVKHGRTASTGANDWIDVVDEPFEGAPPLPRLGATEKSRVKWHAWTVEWYAEVSKMPHCARWKSTDWRNLFDLARMKDQWYKDGDEAKTSLAAEIRHRENALGMTEASRRTLKIRYVTSKSAENDPDLRSEGHQSVEQDKAATDPSKAGKVLSMAERRASIVKSA